MVTFPTHVYSQSVEGVWKSIDDKSGNVRSLIQIEKNGEGILGKILELYLDPWEDPDPICGLCPGDKRNASIVGMIILWDFENADDGWENGKILDPENGKTYKSSVWLEDNNTLRVRGYGGPFKLFHRTQTWIRFD